MREHELSILGLSGDGLCKNKKTQRKKMQVRERKNGRAQEKKGKIKCSHHRQGIGKGTLGYCHIPWNENAAALSRKQQAQTVSTRTQNLDYPARPKQHLSDIYCGLTCLLLVLLPGSWNYMVGLINYMILVTFSLCRGKPPFLLRDPSECRSIS